MEETLRLIFHDTNLILGTTIHNIPFYILALVDSEWLGYKLSYVFNHHHVPNYIHLFAYLYL